MQSHNTSVSIPLGVARAAGFLRLRHVLQLIPVGKTTWWAGVKSGRFPRPVKLSEGVTAWPVDEIVDLAAELKNGRADVDVGGAA